MTHINAVFDSVGRKMTISKNKKIITYSESNGSWNTAYVSEVITPNNNNTTYIATFNILKSSMWANFGSCGAIFIGIECNSWNLQNGSFALWSPNPHYAYHCSGKKLTNNNEYNTLHSYSDGYTYGDTICLKLEFISSKKKGKLYYSKNGSSFKDTKYQIPKQKIKIAVSCVKTYNGIELLSLIKYESNINNEEKQSEISNNLKLVLQISKYENELTKKQITIIKKSEQIEILTDELNKIKSNLFETTESNIRQQNTIKKLLLQIEKHQNNEMKEEENKQTNTIQNDVTILQMKIDEFSLKYNTNKLIEMYNLSEDFINTNNEINKLYLSSKSFNKYMSKVTKFLYQLMKPNTELYQYWNIKEMLSWVSLLENGRYNKYLGVLKKGFESDGIDSGDCLPDLTVIVLREKPFNITNFKDRRDLSEHFQSLQSPQVGHNKRNYEGMVTEYHVH